MERFRTWGKSRSMRLPGVNKGPGAVAVTTVVQNRRPLLCSSRDLVGALDSDLGRGSSDGHARVLVVCVMPDHVHLLVSLDGGGRSLWDYVRYWKTRWAVRLSVPEERPFWQRSFYDHWMRKDEVGDYAAYILANPVRKGLVAEWQDYPFSRCYVDSL